MYRYSEKIEDTRRRPAPVRKLDDQAPETSQASARGRVNRKVLSLEAVGQLRVPETDYSHVVHPTEPSQFAASISRPTSAQVIGFMGRAFTATIFGIRKCSAECRTSPCYGRVLFEGHKAHRMRIRVFGPA